MKLPEEIKNQIIEALKPLEPEKVILFGSYAYGEPTPDSDIDLYIVTKDDFIPQSFKEFIDLKLLYTKKIRSLQKSFGVDIVVHTKSMNKDFINLNSSFSREILKKGVTLL